MENVHIPALPAAVGASDPRRESIQVSTNIMIVYDTDCATVGSASLSSSDSGRTDSACEWSNTCAISHLTKQKTPKPSLQGRWCRSNKNYPYARRLPSHLIAIIGVIRDIRRFLDEDSIGRDGDVKQGKCDGSVSIYAQPRNVLIVSDVSSNQALAVRRRNRGDEYVHYAWKLSDPSQVREDHGIDAHRTSVEFKYFEL
jgi:hypothetical protein